MNIKEQNVRVLDFLVDNNIKFISKTSNEKQRLHTKLYKSERW
jgi:hypothetical protein